MTRFHGLAFSLHYHQNGPWSLPHPPPPPPNINLHFHLHLLTHPASPPIIYLYNPHPYPHPFIQATKEWSTVNRCLWAKISRHSVATGISASLMNRECTMPSFRRPDDVALMYAEWVASISKWVSVPSSTNSPCNRHAVQKMPDL